MTRCMRGTRSASRAGGGNLCLPRRVIHRVMLRSSVSRRAAALAATLVLAACGEVASTAAGGPSEARVQPKHPLRTLRIICRRDGSTVLEQATVMARRDGVHLAVDNRAGETASVNGLGIDVRVGETSHVVPAAPGRVGLACWPGSRHEQTPPPTTSVRVVDPKGFWTSPTLECPPGSGTSNQILDYAGDATGQQGDPVELFRQFRRRTRDLRKDDVFKLGGYPAASDPVVLVIRDGRTIARGHYRLGPIGDGLIVGSIEACY